MGVTGVSDGPGIKGWLPLIDNPGPEALFGMERYVEPPRLSFKGEAPPGPSRVHVWRTRLALWIAPWLEHYWD